MDLRDFIVTPIIVIVVLALAYLVRAKVTDSITRAYFIPALAVKIFGAIALGLFYQFYYGSGDTFMYHTYGSRYLWEALQDSPMIWLRLMFSDGVSQHDIYYYSSRIYFFRDLPSYNIIRFSALFDLFTLSTYSGTAVLFSVLSFIGAWLLFITFYRQYPMLHRPLALATLFVPSVIFWGSGILKDTVTLACIGIATYSIYRLFIERRFSFLYAGLLLVSLYAIYSIRLFILQAYLPAAIVWVMAHNLKRINSLVLRVMLVPIVTSLIFVSAYFAVTKVGEKDTRYSVDQIAKTAQVTAYDIRFLSGRSAGSGYTLDLTDWTPLGMIRVMPAAINVALFRPYLWEVRNPLMFMSALESTFLVLLSIYVLFKNFRNLVPALSRPNVLFCLLFSISFAFATGVSTFNFGTLVRYKIPLLPFFLIALILILYNQRDFKRDDDYNEVETQPDVS